MCHHWKGDMWHTRIGAMWPYGTMTHGKYDIDREDR
jgi:hypothetical protein